MCVSGSCRPDDGDRAAAQRGGRGCGTVIALWRHDTWQRQCSVRTITRLQVHAKFCHRHSCVSSFTSRQASRLPADHMTFFSGLLRRSVTEPTKNTPLRAISDTFGNVCPAHRVSRRLDKDFHHAI
eukprot:327577-Pleurochrysis_carterae.AAC.3